MNWISYPQSRPNVSQTYLVSISRPYMHSTLTFNYIAHYDAETHNWHKYDSFIDKESIGEIITDKIVGWVNLTAYLG